MDKGGFDGKGTVIAAGKGDFMELITDLGGFGEDHGELFKLNRTVAALAENRFCAECIGG